jgi:hypothetical protein
MSKWEVTGKQLVEKLQTLKNEKQIESACQEVIAEITQSYENSASRKNPLATIRKAVSTAFPDSQKQQHSLQYFTDSGKGKKPRYQHLALKYLTFSQEAWDELADDNRKEWKKQQTDNQRKIKLIIDMNNEQTTIEIPEVAQLAMEQLEIEPIELINRALVFYSKSIIGKSKRHEEDLSNVLTEDLLNDKKFSTHPVRASELTKRAVVAIIRHNNEVATENDFRWCITQSAIAVLTGSKPAAIGKTLNEFKQLIDSHNQKFDLNHYSNRKGKDRDIQQEIDLVELVPDGIDLNLG